MKRRLIFLLFLIVLTFSGCEKIDVKNTTGLRLSFQKSVLSYHEIEITSEISESDSVIFPGYAVFTIARAGDGSIWFHGIRKSDSNALNCLVHYKDNMAFLYTFPDYDMQVPFIDHICLDNRNHAFFSGFRGLVEFNGDGFNIYKTQDTAFSNLIVICVNADKEQNIWFSLNDVEKGGIIKTNLSEWSYYSPDNSLLPDRIIRNIEVNSDNQIWLTANDYVGDGTVIRISQGNWKVFPLELYWIKDMTINTQGHVFTFIDYSLSSLWWSNDWSYAMEYDGTAWKSIATCGDPSLSECPFRYITSCVSDYSGNVWISTIGSNSGYYICKYDGSVWMKFKVVNAAFDIIEISDNHFLLGTSGGIFKFSP